MTENSLEKLAKEVVDKRIIDTNKINKYVKDSNKIKTKSDKIIFLKEYVKKSPYPGLYVQDEFLKCASLTKKYSQFITWLVKKDSYILDTSAFTGIFDKNQKLFEFLCVELSKNKEIAVSGVLGTLLGGMGKNEPEKLFNLVLTKNYLHHSETVLMNAIWETSYYHKIPKNIICKILEYTKSKDETIKFKAIAVLMSRFNKNLLVQKKLLQLAKSSDKMKDWISRMIVGISKENKLFCLKLLQQCVKIKDERLKRKIIEDVGYIATDFPVESLAIMKDCIKKSNSPVLGTMLSFSMEQIGKSEKVGKIEKFLFEWINAEKSQTLLQFTLPTILTEIYTNKNRKLLQLLKKINFKQKNKSVLITKTLEKFLSAGSQTKDSFFLADATKILLKIAQHQKIDTSIDERLNDPYMKVLALVENVNLRKKNINPNIAKRNLKQYPNIVAFFGKAKLHVLIEEHPNHPLVIFLDKAQVSKTMINKWTKAINKQTDPMSKSWIFDSFLAKYHPSALLNDLDISLQMIGNVKSKEIRKMLLEPNQFDSALIQVNMFSRLKKKYHVELDPPAGKNKLDLLLTMDKKDYYFEIYTPEENKKLRYIRTVHSIDTEHTKTKISTKLEDQIKAADSLNEPLIVVIDNQNMAVDEFDITNAMFGTYQMTMLFDKKTGKEVKSYPTRKDDSFGRKLKHGNAISAIMLVRREIDHRDLKVKLDGKTIPNPYAKIKLDKKTIQKIEGVVFTTAIT